MTWWHKALHTSHERWYKVAVQLHTSVSKLFYYCKSCYFMAFRLKSTLFPCNALYLYLLKAKTKGFCRTKVVIHTSHPYLTMAPLLLHYSYNFVAMESYISSHSVFKAHTCTVHFTKFPKPHWSTLKCCAPSICISASSNICSPCICFSNCVLLLSSLAV